MASLVAQMVKKKSACNAGDLGSISGSGIFPGEEYELQQKKIHFSILAWRIPWT